MTARPRGYSLSPNRLSPSAKQDAIDHLDVRLPEAPVLTPAFFTLAAAALRRAGLTHPRGAARQRVELRAVVVRRAGGS
eukprot:COSAG06_NODE_8341_length_2199_cov_1.301905_1_plen_79_part_00